MTCGQWRTVRRHQHPPVGRYVESGSGAQHTFTDDFSAATSGGAPTNGLRAYSIRVLKP
jgi:hypothetical protein